MSGQQDRKDREFVKALYPKSSRWARRVDKMSRRQVIAIAVKAQNNNKGETK